MEDGRLSFGPFMLDVARGALLRDGALVALGHRPLAVLAALGETPGHHEAPAPAALLETGRFQDRVEGLLQGPFH